MALSLGRRTTWEVETEAPWAVGLTCAAEELSTQAGQSTRHRRTERTSTHRSGFGALFGNALVASLLASDFDKRKWVQSAVIILSRGDVTVTSPTLDPCPLL